MCSSSLPHYIHLLQLLIQLHWDLLEAFDAAFYFYTTALFYLLDSHAVFTGKQHRDKVTAKWEFCQKLRWMISVFVHLWLENVCHFRLTACDVSCTHTSRHDAILTNMHLPVVEPLFIMQGGVQASSAILPLNTLPPLTTWWSLTSCRLSFISALYELHLQRGIM